MEAKPAKNRHPRAAMYLHSLTDKMIAERCDPPVTELYVTLVVTGQRKGYRVRREIAKQCGMAYAELWPDEDEPAEPEIPEAA